MEKEYEGVKLEFKWQELSQILKNISLLKHFPQVNLEELKLWEKVVKALYDYVNDVETASDHIGSLDFTYASDVKRLLAGIRIINYLCSEKRASKVKREECEIVSGLSHQEGIEIIPNLMYNVGNYKMKLMCLNRVSLSYCIEDFLDEIGKCFSSEFIFILKIIQSRKSKVHEYGFNNGRLENYYRSTFGLHFIKSKMMIIDDLNHKEFSFNDIEQLYG